MVHFCQKIAIISIFKVSFAAPIGNIFQTNELFEKVTTRKDGFKETTLKNTNMAACRFHIFANRPINIVKVIFVPL